MQGWRSKRPYGEERDVIGLVEHDSGMRGVGMTGGNVNINNGVSANLIAPRV